MRISTHNGLEVWLEWRPASSVSIKDAGAVQEWTRLGERPPRVISGEVLVTKGAVEIDVDTLAGHSTIEYRLGAKQANYHDWERDLRVEIKSEEKVLALVYLLPGQDHETYCALVGWSPISQDELAAALASKPGMSDIIPPDLPELNGGVDEEALNALFEADIATTEIQGSPVEEPENSPDVVLDEGPETCPIEAVLEPAITQPPNQRSTGSSLEIIVSRGQHTALPPTPPPDYVERDIASGLYNGLRRLLFGGDDDNRDEWSPEDAEGVAWCRFVYEVYTDSPPLATSEPYILGNNDSAQLSADLAQYARDIELEAGRKQEEDRRAAKQKLEDEERERQEAIERAKEDVLFAETLAVVQKEKRSEAGKKAWQTQLRNGRVTATMLKAEAKATALKRFKDEARSVSKNRKERGVLNFRSSTDTTRQNRLRELGYESHGSRDRHESEAGPSRPTRSVRSDRSRRDDKVDSSTANPLRPDNKALKRTRSFISDDGEIIPPTRDDYDTPPPRLVLDPPNHRPSDRRPRDKDDRRPEIPRHARHDMEPHIRPKTGLRRTDHPGDYGLPLARYPRERGDGRSESAGSSHRRNLRRIDRPEDRVPPNLSRDEGTREQEERQTQERRLAQRERDEREKRQRRVAQKRREEREVREERERREARERVEREEAETRAEEEEERNLGPMEEQMRAFEERKYQRDVKRAQVQRREERKRLRRVQGSEGHPIVIPERPVKRDYNVDRPVGRGSRLSVRRGVIDMTELSD